MVAFESKTQTVRERYKTIHKHFFLWASSRLSQLDLTKYVNHSLSFIFQTVQF